MSLKIILQHVSSEFAEFVLEHRTIWYKIAGFSLKIYFKIRRECSVN